jgi:PAS domain S-box-containing protein
MGGEVLAQLVHPEDFPKVMEHLTRVKDLRDSEIVTIEYRMRDTADRYRWLRSKETVFSRAPDGRVSRVLGVATEISDMKAAQDEIVDANERLRSILANARQSAAEFKLAFDMIPALAWQASSSGTLEALNQRWLEYTGISTENALNGGWLTAFHPDDAHHILSVWRDRLASGEGGETEGRMRRFDGTYRSFLMRSEPLRSEQGGIIRWFGTNTDIEDIKRAERLLAEEKRLLEMVATGQPASEVLNALCQAVEALTEGTCAAILLLDPDTSSLRHGASPSLPESYTHAASSRRISPRTSSLRTTDCSEETFVDDVASGPPWADYCDLPLEHDLRAIWSTPIRSSDGAMLGIIALYAHTARTISSEEERRVEQFTHIVSIVIERGRMDAGLRASVVEKEVLLKEVHHRVKNNLQLISSLLSLQAGRSRDGAEAERFAESRNRVRSMALVHENLYRTGDFASVSMASHVKALCAQLFQAYRLNGQQADLITDIDDLELDLDRAVSVGLIINELVSNALKHAFPDGRAGRVQVSLKQPDGGACALTVRDDGVGLPPGHEAGQSATLGLQLVQDLTQQLHGTMIITRQNGTAFTVTFDTSPEGVRP